MKGYDVAREFTQEMLMEDLRRLGVRKGDKLAVHSSYRKIRPVVGGPQTVIDALLQVVGRHGTVLMPTFHRPVDVFRPLETPSENGILTEMFRRMPHVRRSLHPTHSVAAWGKDAKWIASAHAEGRTALGVDSPFDRLAAGGGKVLLLGASMTRNSTAHVAEAHFRAPYLNLCCSEEYAKPMKVEGGDGEVLTMFVAECPGCSEGFDVIEARMEINGLIRRGMVGRAESMLMRGKDVINTARVILEEDALRLLCKRVDCEVCAKAREFVVGACS